MRNKKWLLGMSAMVFGAVVAQSAVAFDFTWGAWGRAGWAPLVVQGGGDPDTADVTDTATYLGVNSGPGWNGIGGAVGIEVSAANADGNLGFAAKLRVDSGANNGDGIWFPNDSTANIWVKPFNMLTIRLGMYEVDDLRGKIGGLNENFQFAFTGDEDNLLMRFQSGQFGAHLKLQPIDMLQFHASLGSNGALTGVPEDSTAIADIYSTGHYGIGFTLPNILFARVQFIGGKYGKNIQGHVSNKAELWNSIALAFQVTALENLNLDLGVKIPLQVTGTERFVGFDVDGDGNRVYRGEMSGEFNLMEEDDTYQPPIQIALGANYTAGDLGFMGRLLFKLAESGTMNNKTNKTDYTGPFVFAIDLEPGYQIGSIGKIYGDVSFQYKGASETGGNGNKNDTMDLGLGVSFFKTIANGAFSVGVCANIPLGGDGYNETGNEVAKAKALKVAVPIVMTYSF